MNRGDPSDIVIIGSGTGGPNALKAILNHMPELEASIIIVQHMSKELNRGLTNRFDDLTEMKVKLAEEEPLSHGTIYVAPTGKQLKVKENTSLYLAECKEKKFACPSIDVAMKTLTVKQGSNLVGVILSGIGSDGMEGIKHVHDIGGTTMAQNVSTAVISHMPENAIDTGGIDFVLKPIAIRAKLIELFKKTG